MKAEVMKKVIEAVNNHCAKDGEIGEERTFQSLGLDDLDILNVVIDLEEDYNIYISEEDAGGVKTVGDLAEAVMKAIGERDEGVKVVDTIVDDMDEGDAKEARRDGRAPQEEAG